MDAAIQSYRRKRMTVIIAADLAALTEIVLAMRQAVLSPGDLTSAFVSSFFSMFLPTLALTIGALVFLRFRYGKAVRAAAETAEPEVDEGGLVV
ncbi:MAG: hypothetical protein AB1916_14060 [Thermodesulfobacteriota bacterium]